MKEQQRIPTSKVERASSFIKTGAKIGVNYLKYYARKAVDEGTEKSSLHADNASDIYDSLSMLKGSALKVAQMMSMDRNVLPKEYSQKFQMSQYSAPPLSGPLVVNTFRKLLGKSPQELYDQFDMKASNAASIGQVHQAWLGGQKLAVKIQYPGVAESISSDLKMVKPIARRITGISEADMAHYMSEIEARLTEETDYDLELVRSQQISEACAHIPHLFFPRYYPQLSCSKILTMDWIEGMHLGDFLKTNPSQEIRNQLGQALWDFYDFQIHTLHQLHADPHPGNFLFTEDGRLGIIDFGCVKELPIPFYRNYFKLIRPSTFSSQDGFRQLFYDLNFIYDSDSEKEKEFFIGVFVHMASLLGKPFHYETFNFGDDEYFETVYAFGEKLANMKEIRESRVARGVKDSLYINRTYYGLYTMLNELRAVVNTHSAYQEEEPVAA